MPNEKALPSTQKAAVFHEYGGDLKLLEIPIPEIGDDDLLVKVLYTGVCHTDVVRTFIDSKK
jgi:propanol-preferring alcohol dehydrogenase